MKGVYWGKEGGGGLPERNINDTRGQTEVARYP